MAKARKNKEVINGEVNEVIETMENGNEQGAEVSLENVPAEVGAGETGEVTGQAGDAVEADGENQGGETGTVETVSKTRRANGAGSVYPLTNGKGWGFCIQMTADKELRKLYGNKLRHLGTGKTYEETESKCADAISRKDALLAAKLEKLGHKAPAHEEG